MYQGFYQFSRNPFAAPADARHMFMAAGHRDALSGLVLDVLKRRPFVAVAGNGEVGKTTVLNAALANLADQRRRRPVRITRLDHSHLTSLNARQIVGRLLGKRTGELIDDDPHRLLHALTKAREDGSQHVLVVDDVPSVTPGALEFLRLVSGLQTLGMPWPGERRTRRPAAGAPFLQVVLAGRDEFWETLRDDGGGAIHDEIARRAAVEPLADDEVRQYIDYRLKLADSSIAQVVTDAALGDIIRHGQALPGRINRILDRAFTVGAARGSTRLTPRVVDEAVMSLEAANLLPPVPVAATTHRPPCASLDFTASGHVTASGHAGREMAEEPGCSAPTGDRENATMIAPPAAAWRSSWLAGAVAVVGVALTAGILLPRVLPHITAASVASGDRATAAPSHLQASSMAGERAQDIRIPGTPGASREAEAIPDTAARTPDEHPAAPGEAPAENLPQPGLTARTVALPEPPPATMPAGPPAEPADQPGVSEPAAPSMQTAIAPLSAGPVASLGADPATSDPGPSQDTRGPMRERLEAGLATAPPPASSQMAPGPAATSSSSPPAAAPLPPDIVAKLLERGAAMLAAGDISAARLLYGRAADAGSAQAAVAIGKTYEPVFLANKGTIGIQADPTVAAGWYRRAASLGAAPTAASSSEQSAAAIGR